jgi:hypothetical protein
MYFLMYKTELTNFCFSGPEMFAWCMIISLYNDQRNAQVFNLFIYLLLPYMFRAFF